MLWIVNGNESLQIVGCNTFERDGVYQVWVERPNGKNKMIKESNKKEETDIIKKAIDYAILEGHNSLELS